MYPRPAISSALFQRVAQPLLLAATLLLGVVAAATSLAATGETLRLRALLFAPSSGSDAPAEARSDHGEARLTIRPDGDARLDLVTWGLPDGTAEVVLHVEPGEGNAVPVIALPLQRDHDEGRVIGARFAIDADMRERLRNGEGRLVLLPVQTEGRAIEGALRRHGSRVDAAVPIEPPLPSPPLPLLLPSD
ncbi:hypothetical protein ACFFGH_13475 [Lysobacter korlensis]|uniref:Uncharacterized protein n=1 Tax=Lysobacter korlensis TaxID=553636 RepID=A0ABV6RPE2_9GAMM